jgi:hypothetical protein
LCTNSLLKHVTEGKIKGTGRQGRGCKNLLYDLTEKRRYLKLKQEALELAVELALEEAIDLS